LVFCGVTPKVFLAVTEVLEEHAASIFRVEVMTCYTEDGGSTFLQNVGNHPQDHIVSQSKSIFFNLVTNIYLTTLCRVF
jgi:hypothetical protein